MTLKHSIYYKGVNGFGASFEYAYAPGPVTNLALVCIGGRWRLNISEGESGSPSSPARWPRALMLFKPRHLHIKDWCDAWCKAGSPHHMAVAYGHLAEQIKIYAAMQGLDVVKFR